MDQNTTSIEFPKRLFDCLSFQLEHFPLPDMLAAKENGAWRKYSTAEVGQKIEQISAALLKMGFSGGDGSIESRDKIGIFSQNCPEWIMADMAIQQTGAVSVPVYPNITNHELQFILADANVKMIFVGDAALYQKIVEIREDLPALEQIYSFKPVPGIPQLTNLMIDVMPQLKLQVTQSKDAVKETDLATVLYTSGTTGTPKGVMLSHGNIVSNSLGAAHIIQEVGVKHRKVLSFLPLNHGLKEWQPTASFTAGQLCTMPRVWRRFQKI